MILKRCWCRAFRALHLYFHVWWSTLFRTKFGFAVIPSHGDLAAAISLHTTRELGLAKKKSCFLFISFSYPKILFLVYIYRYVNKNACHNKKWPRKNAQDDQQYPQDDQQYAQECARMRKNFLGLANTKNVTQDILGWLVFNFLVSTDWFGPCAGNASSSSTSSQAGAIQAMPCSWELGQQETTI